jgi:integration host factor subunit alpha
MSDKTVTRVDLAEALYQEVGLSKDDCRKLLDDVLEQIANALVEDEEVKLSHFGSFTIRHKTQRNARNPRTGEAAIVSARKIITFKPAHELKRLVDVREKSSLQEY